MIEIAAGIAGVIAFPALRPGLRAAFAFSFGGLELVNGMTHVIHIQKLVATTSIRSASARSASRPVPTS